MATINHHVTKVSVQSTFIKMINEVDDYVYTIEINGKLNITDSKHKAKDLGYTFISKENVTTTFNVNTDELIKLKVE